MKNWKEICTFSQTYLMMKSKFIVEENENTEGK